MAESHSEREDSDGCEVNAEEKEEIRGSNRHSLLASDSLECAVCLQTCIHPVQLPCGHIFCFLCVKGIANQSKRCAMCRHEIPPDYLDHPQLVHKDELAHHAAFDDGSQWFYEGRNGWWQYDERTSYELELAHRRGEKSCELLIAGFLYVVDFENMLQVRRSDPSRRRRVKRDLASIPKKGIAGLRIQVQASENYATALEQWDNRELADGEEGTLEMPTTLAMHVARSLDMSTLPTVNNNRERTKRSSPTLVPPNNTPQTPHTPSTNSERSSPDITLSEHSLNQAVSSLASLSLADAVREDMTSGINISRALDLSLNYESSPEDTV